ncbi:MAG: TrmB family transcriptional regulator [Candidatus Aenigmarchaeota archaeon]|nr:TrmB family transcriptional regulator [Candidatus Aenigmarchaeota archaeon]
MNEDNIESALKSFGLTEYESRAYVTLLGLGTATADELSRRGRIPLPRVYDTLTELQRKGFVLIGKARPKKFNPIPIEKALSNFLFNQKKDFDDKLKHLKDMIPDVKKSASGMPKGKISSSKWNVWSFDRKTNIGRILDEQKMDAKKEILIFSGDLSWLSDLSDILSKLIKKGVEIKAIVVDPKNEPQVAKNIKNAKKIGMKVKTGYDGILRCHIVDRKLASLNMISSKDGINPAGKGYPGSEKDKSYEMLSFDNFVMISALVENFEFWWNKLK